jgi:transketolase
MALAAKVLKKAWRVYTMVGDGELQEGIIWEAAMSARHYRLDNLVAFVDNNRQQSDGFTSDIMTVEPIDPRWRAWGWDVERIDGHDFAAIHAATQRAMSRDGRPHVIVADTVKGKGIREMEDNPEWHSRTFTRAQLDGFLEELKEAVRA